MWCFYLAGFAFIFAPLRGPQSSAPVAKACWIQEKKAVVENLKMKAKVVKF